MQSLSLLGVNGISIISNRFGQRFQNLEIFRRFRFDTDRNRTVVDGFRFGKGLQRIKNAPTVFVV